MESGAGGYTDTLEKNIFYDGVTFDRNYTGRRYPKYFVRLTAALVERQKTYK